MQEQEYRDLADEINKLYQSVGYRKDLLSLLHNVTVPIRKGSGDKINCPICDSRQKDTRIHCDTCGLMFNRQ